MRDAEGIHRLPAGLLLALENKRHDCSHTLGQRRIGRAHQLLVVLDEIDIGVDQLSYHLRALMRPQPKRWLDDAADDRPPIHTSQPQAAGDAELRPGCAPRNSSGSRMSMTRIPVSPLIENVPPMAIVISAERSVPTASIGNPMSASARLKIVPATSGSEGVFVGSSWRSGENPCSNPRLQLRRFARKLDECAGRLVARDLGCQRLGVPRRLDQISEDDHAGSACRASTWLRTGIMSIPVMQAPLAAVDLECRRRCNNVRLARGHANGTFRAYRPS